MASQNHDKKYHIALSESDLQGAKTAFSGLNGRMAAVKGT